MAQRCLTVEKMDELKRYLIEAKKLSVKKAYNEYYSCAAEIFFLMVCLHWWINGQCHVWV